MCGALEPAHGPRVVVVHRDPTFRAALEERLGEQGLQVLGGGRDGPDARTRLATGAAAVLGAQASPNEVCDTCTQAVGAAGLSPALRGGVAAG